MKEALKLALEALESGVDTQMGRVAWTEYDSCLINEAIIAIKEALAQDEQSSSQEPSITKEARGTLILHSGWDDLPNGTKFYTTLPKEQQSCDKRPWVGLTDEEIEDCMEMSIQKTCRAIEAKLEEKNT